MARNRAGQLGFIPRRADGKTASHPLLYCARRRGVRRFAKVGYEGDQFDFYLYGRNLLDEEYATRQVRSGGNWAGRAGEPLVVGANLSFRF